MRLLAFVAFATLAASAATAQPAPPSVPKAFPDYAQPDITPGLCKNVNPNNTQCVIPAMTAGSYLIEAAGTSTGGGADAAQQLTIQVGTTSCGTATNSKPWPANTPRTFKFDCLVTVVTDKPLTVIVGYADAKATKDPKGPTLNLRRVPWDGVINARGFAPQQ